MHSLLKVILVFSVLVLSFFIRTYFSFDTVFSYPVKYAADDGVYHMRIVENQLLGGHFPKRIYFDPYTNFPKGTFIHFGPLYDYFLSFIIWVLTLGNPTKEAIDIIAPFYPPFLGTLTVLVVYLLGKTIGGFSVGLISALLASLSPSLIFRSLLGATDHHVAEYLLSSLGIFFLLHLLKLEHKENIYSLKWWMLVFLTGVSFGLYLLTWEGGLLFLAILFLFSLFHILLNFTLNKEWHYIIISRCLIFVIVFIFILPFLNIPDIYLSPIYNTLHVGAIFFAITFFISLFLLAKIFLGNRAFVKFPFFIFLIAGIISFLIVFISFPKAAESLLKGASSFNLSSIPNEKARDLVGEMRPLGVSGFLGLYSMSIFSLGGFVVALVEFIKHKKPLVLFIVLWFIIMGLVSGIFTFFGQGKYIYYLSIIVVILSALFFKKAFVFGWKGLRVIDEKENKNNRLHKYALTGALLTIYFLVSNLFYPFPFNFAQNYPLNIPFVFSSALSASKRVAQLEPDYYEAFDWIKSNTPPLSLSYYDLYPWPPVEKRDHKVYPYTYPNDAYGILAHWDIGHSLLLYSQRPVVANPFQQGIGKKVNGEVVEEGEAVFFTETDEEKAYNYLDNIRVRYIVTSAPYAHPDILFKSSVEWVQGNLEGYTEEDSRSGPNKFDVSMISRLHIFDGRSFKIDTKRNGVHKEFEVNSLKRLRLVYESSGTSVLFDKNQDVRIVKIFEYVKGARIVGRTDPNRKVSLYTNVITNQRRKFVYQQEVNAGSDGSFEFIVPYSTKKSEIKKWTSLASPYKIKTGDNEIEVNISEDDVLEGNLIDVLL